MRLIRHKQHEHEEMKCDKCEYKTVAKNNLLRHKQYEHEVIKIDLARLSVVSVVSPLLLHGYTDFLNALSMKV